MNFQLSATSEISFERFERKTRELFLLHQNFHHRSHILTCFVYHQIRKSATWIIAAVLGVVGVGVGDDVVVVGLPNVAVHVGIGGDRLTTHKNKADERKGPFLIRLERRRRRRRRNGEDDDDDVVIVEFLTRRMNKLSFVIF